MSRKPRYGLKQEFEFGSLAEPAEMRERLRWYTRRQAFQVRSRAATHERADPVFSVLLADMRRQHDYRRRVAAGGKRRSPAYEHDIRKLNEVARRMLVEYLRTGCCPLLDAG